MEFRKRVNANFHLLEELLAHAILASANGTNSRCANNPQEPDFIAGLVLDFAPDLYNILVRLFPEFRFSISSVYIHQKPLAVLDPPTVRNPEIGDILFVFINKDISGKEHFNSLLFQAKMSSVDNFNVGAAEQHQLKLYTEWPKFTYSRAKITGAINLNGQPRDIQPKAVTLGAQYMLIDKDPILGLSGMPGTFPIGCAIPDGIISLDTSLARELSEFFRFKTGRMFEKDASTTNDDWTKMIWDLLDVSKNAASRRKNAGLTSFPRLSSRNFDGLSFISGGSTSAIHSSLKDLPPFEGSHLENIIEDSGGVSVVLVESSIGELVRDRH